MAISKLKALQEFIIREIFKDAPTCVMRTLPNKELVNMNVQVLAQRLMQGGIDPTVLKNANQVENAINMIENKQKANLAENIRGGIGNTKTAKVFDLEGKEIPKGSKIMGGKVIDDDLPPPGSRGGPEVIAAPVQTPEEYLKNVIEGENKKNIAKIKQTQTMLNEAIDDASPGFSGDRKVDADLVA